MRIVKRLSIYLMKHPMKIMLISLISIIVFAVGARNVEMATGNDTLVSSESDIYKDNQQLEEEFGGESIIILYESTDSEDLITTERLEHMKGMENTLYAEEQIYSIISPVTLTEQIAAKQAETYSEGITEVTDGLEQMGEQLIGIGEKFDDANVSGSNPLPNLDGQMAELNQGINKMLNGQEKLKAGTVQLVNGYSQFGSQTNEVALKLDTLVSQFDYSDPQQQQQAEQLKKVSSQLSQLSSKMIQVSKESKSLPNAPDQTIKGLKGIENGLVRQQEQFRTLQAEQEKQRTELTELGNGLTEMGSKLVSISENINQMQTYSDTLKPGLPEKQETLDYMIKDENGKIRDIYKEVVIDEMYMLMIVKFEGNVSDTAKSDIAGIINSYINKNHLESTEILVSGKPILDDAIRSSMKESMQKMMMLSIMFMVLVLTFTFKVSWRLLPLGIILIAVIGTVGLMGWIEIPITMVSMAVFPILIGLGIDYAIQFQNRYSEEMANEEVPHE